MKNAIDKRSSCFSEYASVKGSEQKKERGWDFFNKLKANGMRIEKGSSAVVNKVCSGEYDVCIGVDYIARSKKTKGTPVDFVHAESGISTVPSPIAIFKATKNLKATKLLYDYILSLEGQKVLIEAQVLPVRPELKQGRKHRM